MPEGLKTYSAQLCAEATFQIGIYRNFLADYLEGERPYPIPGFTLQCVRNEALRAIRDFRLCQMALLTTICDPNTRMQVALSMERTTDTENKIMSLLTHFHNQALEVERAETITRQETHKLPLRSQRSVASCSSQQL